MFMSACFQYGQMGYKINDCPKKRNDDISSQDDNSQKKKPKVQGRVFFMTKQDAKAFNGVAISLYPYFLKMLECYFILV